MERFYFTCLLFLSAEVTYITPLEINDNWPCYFKKCEPNSSKFNTCLFYHANRGIKALLKGDSNSAFPQLVPLDLLDFSIGKFQSFKLNLQNIKVFGLNYLDVYDMRWDLANKNVFIELHFSNTIRISALYHGDGVFRNRNFTGEFGLLDLVYGNGIIIYNMTYQTRLHNNFTYATIDVCKGKRKNKFIRSRLHRPEIDKDSSDEWSVEDAHLLDNALDFDINDVICYIGNLLFRPLFYNFPIDIIFDYA